MGAGGCGRWDPSPTPQRALLRAGLARCGGGTRAPGWGASCLGLGRPGSGALPPPTARPLGGLPGPTTHWLWVRGVAGVGTCHQAHSARSRGLWGRHGGVRGGRLLPGCRASGVGRSPTPGRPPSDRAAGAHYPLAVGAGGCGRGHPSPTPQGALFRAGLARCGGGTRAPGGGVSCLGVGRPGSGALPSPTAGPLGGLPGPTTHWLWVRGVAGPGTLHQFHSARSCVLWGRHERARGGRLLPGCGASGVGRSPNPDGPPSGRAAGAHYPLAVVAGECGRGYPSLTPQRALLRAGFARCGGGMRLPGGGASCLGVGRPGSGALPPPTARPLGGLRGPTTHWLWVLGGAGVGTRHQFNSARSCALWGRHEGARRGCLLAACGASGVGRSPTPDCPPSGRAAGAHYPLAVGAGGCGRGDPSPTSQRVLLRACFARCGGGTRAPGGGASCLGVGRPDWGALPAPTARPPGGLLGPTTHWAVGAGWCGRGHPSPTPQRALLPASFARCGGRTRAPGGAPPAWVWGARGWALSHPRLPALWTGCRGPLPTGCGCGGVRAWGPVTNPTGRALACCGGGTRVHGGGASCLGVGRPRSGALPPPTARPLFLLVLCFIQTREYKEQKEEHILSCQGAETQKVRAFGDHKRRIWRRWTPQPQLG